jgi:hypothetical protein
MASFLAVMEMCWKRRGGNVRFSIELTAIFCKACGKEQTFTAVSLSETGVSLLRQ